MGLGQTKHEYVDRDISPDLLTLIRFADAVSPRLVWVLLVIGIVNLSQYLILCLRHVHSWVRSPSRERRRVPTITWPLPAASPHRRASDPGPGVSPRHLTPTHAAASGRAPLAGLAQLLREGLRNREGFWARFQWK